MNNMGMSSGMASTGNPYPGDIRGLFRKEDAGNRRSSQHRQTSQLQQRSAAPLQISLTDHQHHRSHSQAIGRTLLNEPPSLAVATDAIYIMEDSDNDLDDDYYDTVGATTVGSGVGGRSVSQHVGGSRRSGLGAPPVRQTSMPTMPPTSTGSMRGGNVIYSGWLVKQGKIWKSWKKRYFVLLTRTNTVTGEPFSTLQYYKSHRFAQLKGEIALDDASATVRYVDIRKSKRAHCFELIKGFTSLVCQAKDDDDCKQWFEHLHRVIEGADTMLVAPPPSSTRSNSVAGQASMFRQSSLGMDDSATRVANELRRLLSDPKSPEATKCQHFVKHFDARSSHAFSTLQEFIQTMRTHMGGKFAHGLVAMVSDDHTDDDEMADLVAHCIHRQVEEAVFIPLHDGLYSSIRRSVNADHEASLNKKLRWLQGKDQAFFDIPQHQLSPTEWREAVRVLTALQSYSLPIDKYEALADALAEIQATYLDEHPVSEFVFQVTAEGLGFNSLVPNASTSATLDTDDLIPIFTFLLVNSGVENLLMLKQLLGAMHQEKDHRSGGAASSASSVLSILGAAMDFVQNVTIPAVLEDIFKEQIAFSIDGDWRLGVGFEPESTYRCGAMVKNITAHGQAALGGIVSKGHVLVTLNGTNVVLWPYNDVVALLQASTPPHRMAFISNPNYVKILGSNKSLWNVALLQACQRGAVASVQMLLANGADVNYLSDDDTTPLHVAVSNFHINVVSYLLQHGAKTKMLTACGRGPLHLLGAPIPPLDGGQAKPSAASTTTLPPPDKVRQIVHKLVRHGAAVDAVDHFGYTPLMLLASKGCLEGVDTLMELSKTIQINARCWHTGCTALACAAKEGQSEVTTALLDYGADPSVKSLRGETPMHFAASIADLQTCAVLLSEGKADVNARSVDGWTPLMLVVSRGHLMSNGGAPPPARDTAAVLDTVRLLLSERANVRDICNMYRQAIHYAALHGGADVFHFLKSHPDVDVHVPDITGKSALQLFEQTQQTTFAASRSSLSMSSFYGTPATSSSLDSKASSGMYNVVCSCLTVVVCSFAATSLSPDKASCPIITRQDSTDLVAVVDPADAKDELPAVAISDLLPYFVQYDTTHVRDIEAFLWSGRPHVPDADVLRYFQMFLGRAQPPQLTYARRVVLWCLDIWIQLLQESKDPPLGLCIDISNTIIHMLPSIVQSDPVVLQWLTTRKIAPFVKACQNRAPFAAAGPCDAEYAALVAYVDSSRPMSFLEASAASSMASTLASEVEDISDKVRQRLLLAGVQVPEPAKAITAAAPAKRRFSVLDRVARLWQLDIDPGLMASQITLLQHWFFQKIPISELVASKKNATTTPAYDKSRLLHNHISLWVINQILAREDVVDRGQILSYYVKVAGKCLTPLRNFDGFVAIMYALNDSSIFRLKKTWGRLPPSVRSLWQELKQWTEKGARPLHKLIKEAAVPSIPYLGLIAQQFIVAQEYPDFVQTDLVNLKKLRLRGGVVRLVLPCQKTPYIFAPDRRLLDHMCAPLQLATKDFCFTRSLEVEPRIAEVE
ncbi:Aste57867_23014 [Aphanomyces stellatus]|uniref:Aste57867_23014 protein n=1 Tax=Aphanomyces stellatus TaxID=120398 RepID=A0A485LME8_9STRA|nr:hypothetical protein As57867_022943 [Aphanomyces stellatus]VFT99662.1 Aste57867_23014 [Aphanomyces stellatus]